MSKCCLFDGKALYATLGQVMGGTPSDGSGNENPPEEVTTSFAWVTEFPQASYLDSTSYRVLNTTEFNYQLDSTELHVAPLVRSINLENSSGSLISKVYMPVAWRVPKSAVEGRAQDSRILSYNVEDSTDQHSIYVSDLGSSQYISQDDLYWYLNLLVLIQFDVTLGQACVVIPGDSNPYPMGESVLLNVSFIDVEGNSEVGHTLEVEPRYTDATAIEVAALPKPAVVVSSELSSAPSWFNSEADQLAAVRMEGNTLYVSNPYTITEDASKLYTILRFPTASVAGFEDTDVIGTYTLEGSTTATTLLLSDAYALSDGYSYVPLATQMQTGARPYAHGKQDATINILGTVYDIVYELVGTPIEFSTNAAEPNYLNAYRYNTDLTGVPVLADGVITVTNGTKLPTVEGAKIFTMVQVPYADLYGLPSGYDVGFLQDVTYGSNDEIIRGAITPITSDNLSSFAVARSGYWLFHITAGIVNDVDPYVVGHTDKILNIYGFEVRIKFDLTGKVEVIEEELVVPTSFKVGVRSSDWLYGAVFDVYNIGADGELIVDQVTGRASTIVDNIASNNHLRTLTELAVAAYSPDYSVSWDNLTILNNGSIVNNLSSAMDILFHSIDAYRTNKTSMSAAYSAVNDLAQAYVYLFGDSALTAATTATVPDGTVLGYQPLMFSDSVLNLVKVTALNNEPVLTYDTVTTRSLGDIVKTLPENEIISLMCTSVVGLVAEYTWSTNPELPTGVLNVTTGSIKFSEGYINNGSYTWYYAVFEAFTNQTITLNIQNRVHMTHVLNWLRGAIETVKGA